MKGLVGIPWRVALALGTNGGWILRSAVIWQKLNPKPESVTDRPSDDYEHLFLFSKSEKYYFDKRALPKLGRTSVWPIETTAAEDVPPGTEAPFPLSLIAPCLQASTRENDAVLDPFVGSGTVPFVARSCGRRWTGIDIDPVSAAYATARVEAAGEGSWGR